MDSASIVYRVAPVFLKAVSAQFNIKLEEIEYTPTNNCIRVKNGIYQGYCDERYYKSEGYKIVDYVDFNLYIDESRRIL